MSLYIADEFALRALGVKLRIVLNRLDQPIVAPNGDVVRRWIE